MALGNLRITYDKQDEVYLAPSKQLNADDADDYDEHRWTTFQDRKISRITSNQRSIFLTAEQLPITLPPRGCYQEGFLD